MTLSVSDRNDALSEDLRDLLHRRLGFALSRFDSRIRRTSVVVEDVNGPRGGIDKVCRITVTLSGAQNVVISDQDKDLAKCITHAADRVGRAVARSLNRSHTNRRRTAGFAPLS